jgi:hypothetical protein
MAFDSKGLDDYIDVAQRIADFRERYPDGSLQPADLAMPYHVVRVPNGWCRRCTGSRTVKIVGQWKTCPRCEGTGLRSDGEPAEDVFIVYYSAAYRTPDDQRPGIGAAWETFPGHTPYTANSELMNAETSAQGRAIVAALASDSKRGVSSREEIRNRQAEHEDPAPAPAPPRVKTAHTDPEHVRLVHASDHDRKAERVTPQAGGPQPDAWTDQPPGEFNVAAVTPENQPGTIDGRQRAQIFGAFKVLGISEAEDQRATLTAILGREVSSRKGLSYTDAEKVLKDLKARQAAAS